MNLVLILPLLLSIFFPIASTSNVCTDPDYSIAANSHLHHTISSPLAGHTRSHSYPNLYTLLTPNSRVYASLPSQWTSATTKSCVPSAAAVITPALGAHFSMYILHACRETIFTSSLSIPTLQSFLYILHGEVHVTGFENLQTLQSGAYLYLAPQSNISVRVTSQKASFIQIDRIHTRNLSPKSTAASENDIEPFVPSGEQFRLRRLLDPTDSRYDFNIHIMDFSPGQYLNIKELHYNQHGLVILQGHGIYMLNERYMPVTTGDVIYMAPFVPQWYAALGETDTRYFLYKDTNVDPLDS